MRRLLFLGLLVAACSMIWWGSHALRQAGDVPDEGSSEIGHYPQAFRLMEERTPVPEVSYLSAQGKAIESVALSQYRGQVVLLNLWATWCAPCVEEMPALDSLQQSHGARGLQVLPVSQDVGPNPKAVAETVRGFYARHQLEALPVALDQGGRLFQAMQAKGLPVTIIIDKRGRMRARVVGVIDWQSDWFINWLERLLAEAP